MNACLDSSYINPEIGKIKLKNLTTIDIQRLYNKKFKVGRVDGIGGLAPRSVERIHTVLNGALEKALGVHKIQFNPAKATELPGYEESSDENKIRVLSIKEQLKFEKQALKDRLGAGFMLSVYNGLRRGEILGLSWSDLDLFDNKIRTCQNKEKRVYYAFIGSNDCLTVGLQGKTRYRKSRSRKYVSRSRSCILHNPWNLH